MASAKKFLPLLILTAAVLALFWPARLNPSLILHSNFYDVTDMLVIHWPKAHLLAQSWQAGHGLPWWTPLILSGMPLAANQLAMLFYPPAWLFTILPIEPVFNGLFIFHLLAGGSGIYFLLREYFRLAPAAALAGALTFALNGKWLAHAAGGHVSMVGAVGWLAWSVFGMHMLLRSLDSKAPGRWLGWLLLTAVTVALQIVTHTLPVIYSAYLLGAMALWHTLVAERTHRWRTRLPGGLAALAAAMLLAALLGAAQLLPLLELAGYSNRALSLELAAEFSFSPAQLLVGLLLPAIQGGHEYIIYLGLLPLLLLPFGLSRANRWSWFYAGVFLFALLFALGPATPLHGLFYHFAPGFGWIRTPARIFFVGAIAAAVLVGLAVQRLTTERWPAAARRWVERLAVALGALALLLGLGLAFGFGQLNRATLALALVVPLGLALIVLRVKRLLSSRAFAAAIIALLLLDLGSFDASLLRFVAPAEAFAPGRDAAEWLAGQEGLFRVYSPSYSLPMQTAAAHNLQLADGVEPVHLAVVDAFMARAGGYGDPGFSVTIPHFGAGPIDTALKDIEPNLKLLGLLNVRYLAAAFPMEWPGLSPETVAGDTHIYRNAAALPRAWVAHQTRPAETDWLSQLESLPNLADVVLVDAALPQPQSSRAATAVTARGFAPNVIELETSIEAPGWLVLSEIWYPGWQATVNGQPQPVAVVDGLLRGVYLPQPGSYAITVDYRPASVGWGQRLSLAGVVLVLALAAGWGIVQKKRSPQSR